MASNNKLYDYLQSDANLQSAINEKLEKNVGSDHAGRLFVVNDQGFLTPSELVLFGEDDISFGNPIITDSIILHSATENSNKYFRLTIYDDGSVRIYDAKSGWDFILKAIETGNLDVLDIGQKALVTFGNEGTVEMVLVAKNKDKLTSGGTASTTWIGAQCVSGTQMYRTNTTDTANYGESLLKTRVDGLYDKITDSKLKTSIKEVTKTHFAWISETENIEQLINCKMWVPSFTEIFATKRSQDPNGLLYNDYFSSGYTTDNRLFLSPSEYANGTTTPGGGCWLRSASGKTYNSACIVNPSGGNYVSGFSIARRVLPAFCI